MTKKVYLAGKITGNDAYKEEFMQWESFVFASLDCVIENPINHPKYTGPSDNEKMWRHYMKESIRVLIDCDAVVFLPGWEDSKGATIEHQIALWLGLEIYYGVHYEQVESERQEEVGVREDVNRFGIVTRNPRSLGT